ncbi:hypothetical protein CspeluHIS016_0107730 [Cutaneotrichosporon spelunceum]|uniref:TFIID-18kDa-domain-containing protein n=1 Tax=Cutaneotrichosporon spelunceum TaxID=1672016 RepID=A0AAD3Y9U6_9TREE|nr:hypothetical protein CspeluHIS016_0107730 [Cutaneotrichosporon spelunceum]
MSGLAIPNTAKRPSAGLALPGAGPSTSNSPAPSSTAAIQLQPRPSSAAPVAQVSGAGGRAGESGRLSASPSPEPDEDGDGDGDDDDDEGLGQSSKKSNKNSKKKKGAAPASSGMEAAGKQDYRYTNEISQMMFVFGEVQDPLPETVKLVEDIVRGQIIEIVTRARLLTHIRSSRFLSAEDLIFLIRDDRGKVNRLRTYLSWKDVRKKAKEEEDGDVDVEETDKANQKGRRPIVKLSWELLTPFSDFLRSLPTQQNRNEDEEEEDDDELQAHQDSMQRLRDADEITKKMTKDEYVHYSDCRQASFTYRKARRFRDFINFSAYLDVRPNDDIVDILGFLAFEMVRSLCVTALDVREQLEKSSQPASGGRHAANASPLKRKLQSLESSPTKRARNDLSPSTEPDESRRFGAGGANATPRSLFAPPPSARQPLLPSHVLEAFAQIQRKQTSSRVGGMRNWRGAMTRGRVALV